jgi:hypothetical protein
MEIKEGQWLRTPDNDLIKLEYYCHCEYCQEREFNSPIFSNRSNRGYYNGFYSQEDFDDFLSECKKSDMPQELVQIGDVVELKKGKFHYMYNPFGLIREISTAPDDSLTYITISDKDYNTTNFPIIKIFTPNKNGGYDLQWEKENE